jgi:hypothetical protein
MAKRSSVPGRAGHPYQHTLSRRLWRGASMLVAASAAGAVFVGPHADTRASAATADGSSRPLVAQQPALTGQLPTGPLASPGPGGHGAHFPAAGTRSPAPVGVAPQLAPHAPVGERPALPDSLIVALPEYIAPAPLVMPAPPQPARLLAEPVTTPRPATVTAGSRLAFDRWLTWTGASMLGAALTGLTIVARRRRAW